MTRISLAFLRSLNIPGEEMRNRLLVGMPLVATVLASTAPSALSVFTYTQDFEGSPAAGEYASGDFDPVPQIGGSEGVFFESNPAAVQVVDSSTVVNGSPAGPPRILGGNNALKISGDDAPSCCQHYQIIPGSASGSGATEATLTFSFYGVPSDDGGDGQRLVEVWANEGGNLGVTGGPGFVFEFRFDENGSVFYDSAGGWDDAGITVPLHQWNTITISSRVDGVNRPLVTLNINGVLHDNGGVGFGDSSETARTIDRFQFSSSNSTGSGSGSFIDDISLSLVLPPINAIPYAQDFEGSPAADEYASGDFDPVPTIGGSEGVFSESDPAAVQVVDANTIVNGSPGGPPRVHGANNALKISGADASGCCQHYQIFPGRLAGSGPAEAILTFSFYGVPSDDGDDGQRLVEVWANEGGVPGDTGGPGFVFEFRFDENGSVFYGGAGGWGNAGLAVPLHQWNTITISSRVDGVNQPFVTLDVNGVLHDNGGVGFGHSSETPQTIDRFQFSSSISSGPGSGSFFDDINLVLFLPFLHLPTFVDRAPQLAPGMDNSNTAWCDFNNDGFTDLYTGSALHRNDGGTGFTKLPGYGWGVWADIDNDGFPDIFDLTADRVLRNVAGSGNFTVVPLPPFPGTRNRGACWADLNGDSYVDLYVGAYESPGYEPDAMFMNQGGTSFTHAWTEPALYETTFPGRGVTACDYDEDGDVDIYVSNYRLEANYLWRNNGSGGLTDVAPSAGVHGEFDGWRWSYGHSIGSCFGDINNDGHFDLFVGNFSHADAFHDRARFYENNGGPTYDFTQRWVLDGSARRESYASPSLADYDNDGDLDLYYSTVYSGDFARLWRNDGNWSFSDVTVDEGLTGIPTSYQSAWADFNNDGFLDLATGGRLYENRGNANHWLKIRLRGNRTTVNASAIGAQARIDLGGGEILSRQVEAGTGEGNQNDLVLHFGLGQENGPVNVQVTWPGGAVEMFPNLAVDQFVELPFPLTPNITALSTAGGVTVVLQWQSEVGRTYRVEMSPALDQPFALLDLVSADPPINTYHHVGITEPTATYRIVVDQ